MKAKFDFHLNHEERIERKKALDESKHPLEIELENMFEIKRFIASALRDNSPIMYYADVLDENTVALKAVTELRHLLRAGTDRVNSYAQGLLSRWASAVQKNHPDWSLTISEVDFLSTLENSVELDLDSTIEVAIIFHM